ncbi:archease [Candidatus Micrarchaeota archaeon]|nr:archease [Candidatus Micrarchaeota archaeon]
MPHKFLENVSLADLAFEAEEDGLADFFKECATALFGVMANTETIKPVTEKRIEMEDVKVDSLLHKFLEEIVYLKDAEQLVFCECDVRVSGYALMKLNATLRGEKIDRKRHELHNDVKAVTWNDFKVTKQGNHYKVKVVLDI